jgi:DDE superfamily endonuclease
VASSRGVGATVWRWLAEDAIRPWNYRSWIFLRDRAFRAKAARVLDLYAGRFEGKLLHPGEFVLCADEKPSIQARARLHPTAAPRAGGDGQLVEHEYERMGALCYLAAWDVKRAKLFDRCEQQSGIAPFDRLVAQVMGQEPYASARRVFWIGDNGSSHRGQRSIDRLEGAYPNLVFVHLPIHASWLNQIEIYFSIVQRKVLQPNDFNDLAAVEERLLRFGRHYEQVAQPFEWKFTRAATSTDSSNASTPPAALPRSPRDGTCERNHLGQLAPHTTTGRASSNRRLRAGPTERCR